MSLEQLRQRLDTVVAACMAGHNVAGIAYAVVKDRAMAFDQCHGLADRERDLPITDETVFCVGSIAKTATALGVLMLAESGRVDLDAPVQRYLTRWRLPASRHDCDGVTARRLLSHTAGLSVSSFAADGFAPDAQRPDLVDMLSGTNGADQPVLLDEPPGARWRYSGGGFGVLQLMVEEVTGRDFAAHMHSALFEPLGMRSTGFGPPPALRGRCATPYDTDGACLPQREWVVLAAGGLYSSLADLPVLVTLLAGGDTNAPVSPAAVTLMGRAVAPATAYGLGIRLAMHGDRTFLNHSGRNPGWYAHLALEPSRGDGLVVLTNSANGALLTQWIADEWQAHALGQPGAWEPPRRPIQLQAGALRRVTGDYLDARGNRFSIVERGGTLVSLVEGSPVVLLPLSDCVFFTAAARMTFHFEFDANGVAYVLRLRYGGDREHRAARVPAQQTGGSA